MNYIFLDVEWNQMGKNFQVQESEILEIAAIGINEDFNKAKKFFRFIRPKNIEKVSNGTLKMLHIERRVLEQAKSIKDILRSFQCTYSKAKVLVVWSRESYELFDHVCKENGKKFPVERVLVLQELLADIDSKIKGKKVSIQKMFRRYHVQFRPHLLHLAKYDVEYLRKLFSSVRFQYRRQCDLSYTQHVYQTKSSEVLHVQGCHYINEKRVFESNQMEIFKGKRLCRHCCQRGYFSTIPIDLSQSPNLYFEAQVARFCDQYQMTYHFSQGVCAIKTIVATWRIYHDGEEITAVFHENYRKNRYSNIQKHNKYYQGFHKQNVKTSNIRNILQYIYYHDKNFFLKSSII